eukprot:scaffold604_cov59-Phaeocystis_antarctica.AAC.7
MRESQWTTSCFTAASSSASGRSAASHHCTRLTERRLSRSCHQIVRLHQRQHLRAGRRPRRQLLEAAQRRFHRDLLERGQHVAIGEPPHVERIAWRELRLDRAGARHHRASARFSPCDVSHVCMRSAPLWRPSAIIAHPR